jgi:RNA polymerase sigma-70 factor, ECF subfamily
MMTLPSDELLLAAFTNGDRSAFDRLTARYTSVLDAYFRRRLPDDGRVEELRQETLLAVFALLPSYEERGKFRPLLFSIAYRKLVSSLRSQKETVPLPEELPARTEEGAALDVRSALLGLPEPLREALLLTRVEGLTCVEAGEVLGCSADAVRARVCRARSLLACRLSPGSWRKK